MTRQLIVVDVETSGLHELAAVLEVAAVNVDTGEYMRFVPRVTPEQLGKAQPEAMTINRYYERRLYLEMLNGYETECAYQDLQFMLNGNTFAGSNPAFDSALIAKQAVHGGDYTRGVPVGQVWHHRLADLAAYAAGKLSIDPTELPGLDAVADRVLGLVEHRDRHTALVDAQITADCFRALREIGGSL